MVRKKEIKELQRECVTRGKQRGNRRMEGESDERDRKTDTVRVCV